MGYANTKKMPSKEFLMERFLYNQETGIVTWANRPRSHFKGSGYGIFQTKCVGKKVGHSCDREYLVVGITDETGYRTTFMLHRIIYKMMMGVDPEFIDHINGDRKDNRWCNLRSVSISENNMNSRMQNNNTTGHAGVYLCKNKGYYFSAIIFEKNKIHLGTYDDVATAGAAYRGAAAAITAITGKKFLTDRCRKLATDLVAEDAECRTQALAD